MKNILKKISLACLVSAMLFSCAKKELAINSKYQEEMKKRSLEIEQSSVSASSQASAPSENVVAAEQAVSDKTIQEGNYTTQKGMAKVSSALAVTKVVKSNLSEKQQKKIQRIAKKQETNRGGLNYNLKLGLILLIVGLLVASLLSGLIGSIVIIVGVVFIILGLLEVL